MQELRNLGAYTRVLKRRLPERCFRPVPGRLWWMALHLAVVSGGIAALALARPAWPVALAISVAIGISFAGLGFLGHEILHGSVVSHPLLRNTLGGLCFTHFWVGARLWRKWHVVEHHGHTQDGVRDPDTMGKVEDYLARPGAGRFFHWPLWVQSPLVFLGLAFWFTFHGLHNLRRYYPGFAPGERRAVLAQFLAPFLFWAALPGVVGPRAFAFGYLLPAVMANWLVMSFISTNHMLNPLTPVNDPLINALTVIPPRWVSVLFLNFGYHVEHHVFPSMSGRYTPEVHRLIKELWPERYQAMPHWKALRALWRTPRMYKDGEHLIELRRNLLYPVLGSGMDPDHVVGVPIGER